MYTVRFYEATVLNAFGVQPSEFLRESGTTVHTASCRTLETRALQLGCFHLALAEPVAPKRFSAQAAVGIELRALQFGNSR